MIKHNNKTTSIREAVATFHDAKSLQGALDDLQTHGFSRHHVSVLANAETVEKKLKHIYRRVEEVEDDPEAPRTIFVPLESIGEAEGALIGLPLYVAAVAATAIVVASGGTLLTAIMAAAGAGAGGAFVGNIFAGIVVKHHADYIQDQIEHGGLLLWVNLPDNIHEKRALEILSKHSSHDVHVHEIPTKSSVHCTLESDSSSRALHSSDIENK
jgi:hypothetical protein